MQILEIPLTSLGQHFLVCHIRMNSVWIEVFMCKNFILIYKIRHNIGIH